MLILPIHSKLEAYLEKHQLVKRFEKQKQLLEKNIFHPGLNVELLEPKQLKVFSFRVDHKYRAVFIFHESDVIEVVDINNHYN